MKKAQQANYLIGIVALAFLFKGITTPNVTFIFVGVLLLLLSVFRYLLMKQAAKVNVYKKMGKDSILRYFDQNQILYVHMKEVYKRGYCDVLYEENDGILLYDRVNDTYLATATTLAGAKDIVEKLPVDYQTFIAHDPIFDELENKQFKISSKLYSYNHMYTKKEPILIVEHQYICKDLDETYLPIIKEHYTIASLCNDAYLLPRIKEGMIGVFDKEELLGYIGIHASGAMGMMEVFPPHQGKKVGTLLQSLYTNRMVEKQKRPIYTQVNAKNEASLHMQEKLHFKKAGRPCIWYFS